MRGYVRTSTDVQAGNPSLGIAAMGGRKVEIRLWIEMGKINASISGGIWVGRRLLRAPIVGGHVFFGGEGVEEIR